MNIYEGTFDFFIPKYKSFINYDKYYIRISDNIGQYLIIMFMQVPSVSKLFGFHILPLTSSRSRGALAPKNKAILNSQTFKVREEKVTLY